MSDREESSRKDGLSLERAISCEIGTVVIESDPLHILEVEDRYVIRGVVRIIPSEGEPKCVFF